MNIHEYQGKQLFEKFQVATPRGVHASSAEEAYAAALQLGVPHLVVKAQIHAGGRGKGTFTNGFQGGVHLCDSPQKVKELASEMIGNTLKTHQTGPAGRLVRKVLVAESVEIAKEYYFAIFLNRALGAPLVIASTEGGVDIEKTSEQAPEKIIRHPIHPLLGLQAHEARRIAQLLGFSSSKIGEAAQLFLRLYDLFVESDCSLIEVNPLVLTKDDRVLALDAKFDFDDNALFRHPEICALRDTQEEDPREVAASQFHLNYVGLSGNIACLVNGAGLAMSTMDIIQYHGGSPANFLDVGGGASQQQVTEAFKLLISDPNVKAILVNIFGGIMRCDVIAQGIIHAVRAVSLPVPLVVRLEGTNVDLGKELLKQSQLPIIAADSLTDAAKKVVEAARDFVASGGKD